MVSTVLPEKRSLGTPRTTNGGVRRKWWMIAAAVAVVAIGAGLFLWIRYWPFNREPVVSDLADASDSTVTAGSFHKTYFPPGCVIEDLVFRHANLKAPLITIKKLTIRGSYAEIVMQHVGSITAEGLHVFIPPFGSQVDFHTHASKIVVNEIVANGSVVEFLSRNPDKEAQRFEIHEAVLRNVGWKDPLDYEVKVHIPTPPGEVEASGKFGVWKTGGAGETPVSGKYTFHDADLGVFGGIGGILSSAGKFQGRLEHIDISGTTDTPQFEVRSSGHSVHLSTGFDAYVDGTHGDTFLRRVDAHFGQTHVVVNGSIAGVKGRRGKTAKLELASAKGRIDDVLGLFVRERRSPMSGETALRAKIEIPPGEDPFLEKLRLDGSFGVDEGSFTKTETQNDVNRLSAGARGENKDDPQTVLTDLTGQVVLQRGVATFTDLSFAIPGANARMHGTYGIINHKIDLHGDMQVDTKMSKTTTGMKSLLLKMMDPFFKKKPKGEIVPVHIGGTYEHPQFGLDIDKDAPASKAAPDKQAGKDQSK